MTNTGKKGIQFIVSNINLKLVLISLILILSVITIKSISAQTSTLSNPSVCCEKTNAGAYCINTEEQNCNANFKTAPTSCESTSYCKLGTCYDSSEGICMENTPQRVCADSGGTWDPRPIEEVPQCGLGCCIIEDQAAFVSLVRCKRLSSFFGVENNYRTDITSEVECIAAAQSQDMGACVYEEEFERVCKFTTKADCGASEVVETANGSQVTISNDRKFYKDMLCSAEELNTACAKQTSTTCYQGKVYWQDSCNNRENVYSSNTEISWNSGRTAEPDEICNPNDGSDNNCGNCEYLLGSRCEDWDGLSGIGKPSGSDHYCQKTECTDSQGNSRINGESWCVYEGDAGNGLDAIGSRYFREVCIDGEVRVEPCADFRNEICIEDSISTSAGDFATAGCRVNRWQDCLLQAEEDDCTNWAKRDCMWLPPVKGLTADSSASSTTGSATGFSNPTGSNSFNNPTSPQTNTNPTPSTTGSTTDNDEGICVPNSPPGLNFWEESSAQGLCGQVSAQCQVVYEKGLIDGSWKIKEGAECLEEDWALKLNRVCTAVGDCGGYINYVEDYTDDGYNWISPGNKPHEITEGREFTPNGINKIKGGFTGLIIKEVTGK